MSFLMRYDKLDYQFWYIPPIAKAFLSMFSQGLITIRVEDIPLFLSASFCQNIPVYVNVPGIYKIEGNLNQIAVNWLLKTYNM